MNPTAAPTAAPLAARLLPRSLFARVTLIIVVGMTIAQLLAFDVVRGERDVALRTLMFTGVERDIASSVAILDRLPAAERPGWLERLERRNFRFELGGAVTASALHLPIQRDLADAIVGALPAFPVERIGEAGDPPNGLRLQVRLHDGSALVVVARPVAMPVPARVLGVLAAQLAVLAACAWVAVRLVTRPLARLAAAADDVGPDLKARTLDEAGPTETAGAARAFNAMQRRIAGILAERVEILAAISHDLQTPLTRLRLRTDLMDDEDDQARFRHDLEAMQALVREGLTYARTLHGTAEPPQRLDADALLESLVADYADAGQGLRLEGRVGPPLVAQPVALRRILVNLVDNALKFGTDVALRVEPEGTRLALAVLDDGPGIPPGELEAVLRPFHRVEGSRNRDSPDSGGTGLGLAIAHQLATAMGAELRLRNRAEGGLEARLLLPASASASASTAGPAM